MLAVQRDTVSKLFSEAISHLFSDPYHTKSVSICIDHFQFENFSHTERHMESAVDQTIRQLESAVDQTN